MSPNPQMIDIAHALGMSHLVSDLIIADWILLGPDVAQLGAAAYERPWLRFTNGVDPSQSCRLYARASDREAGMIHGQKQKLKHDPHTHPRCLVNKPGWVVLIGQLPRRGEDPANLRGRACDEKDEVWLQAVRHALRARSTI